MSLRIAHLGVLVSAITICVLAYAQSFGDLEQAIQAGNLNEASTLIRMMRASGAEASDLDRIESLVKAIDDESAFRRNASIYARVPNNKTFTDTRDAYAKLATLGKFTDLGIKLSREFLQRVDEGLAEDKAQMSIIAADFEPRRKQLEFKEAKEQAEQQRIEAERAAEAAARKAQLQREADQARVNEVRYQAAMAERQRECGGQIGQPRIGMSQALLFQCVPFLQLVSETNRSDGVLSTYIQPDGMRVLVLAGKVVSWSK